MEWTGKAIDVDELLKKSKITEYVEIYVKVIRETSKGYYIQKDYGKKGSKPESLKIIPKSEVHLCVLQKNGVHLLRVLRKYGERTGLIQGD